MRPLIHDSTLRDGNHAAKHKLSLGVIEHHCNLADRAGINSVEVGHGNGLGASSFQVGLCPYSDAEMLTTAKKALTKTKLAVHVMPGFATFEKDIKPAIDMGVNIFRVGTHCTESDLSISFLEKLTAHNVEVLSCLMMSHMADPEQLLHQAKFVESLGAQGVCIYDSAGSFDMDRTKEVITILTENLSIPVGFHGHNNLGLAIGNSYTALLSGAEIFDASICSYGAGAGNTQLEVLASYFESKGYKTGINLPKLYDLVSYASSTYAQVKPFSSTLSIVSGMSGVFSGFANHVIKASAIYNVDSLDLFKNLGKKGIVGGQEDQIYTIASEMSNTISNLETKKTKPKEVEFKFTEKKSAPRKLSQKEYRERCDYSISARSEESSNEIIDSRIQTLVENVRSQGKLYFDGPRSLGYGGYVSNQNYWSEINSEIIDFFKIEKSQSFLDIGCAKGYMIESLINNGFLKCYGIDSSEYAIKSSPSLVKEKLINASLLHIPFPTNFFDFSVCIDVLQEIPVKIIPAAIREINRVSKQSLIVLPAIKSEEKCERELFLNWSITAQTAKTKMEWQELLQECGYTGYYSVFYIDLDIK